jgi:hypothetical protein
MTSRFSLHFAEQFSQQGEASDPTEVADDPSATTIQEKQRSWPWPLAACRRLEARIEGRLKISGLSAVQLPTLWRRIDVSGNRRRHPTNTEASKDQQDSLLAFTAPDRP